MRLRHAFVIVVAALWAGCSGRVSGLGEPGDVPGTDAGGGSARGDGGGSAGGEDAGGGIDGGGGAGNDAGSGADAGDGADAGGSEDAGVDAGPAGCTAVFCDDFEAVTAGSPPASPWTVAKWQTDSVVEVDTAHAHSGQNALKVAVSAGGGKRAIAQLKDGPVFPLAGNVMWGRMWIWLTQAPPDGVHWTNIQGEGPVKTGAGFRSMYRYGGMNQQKYLANYETSGVSTDCWRNSATKIPEGKWACFEWKFDGPANEMDFWVDGTAISDLTVIDQGDGCIAHDTQDEWIAPDFDTLNVGWEHYQSSSIPISMWIDDVAVGTSRVGCQ